MLPLNFCAYRNVDGLQRGLELEQSIDHTLYITAQGQDWQTMIHGRNPTHPLFFVCPAS